MMGGVPDQPTDLSSSMNYDDLVEASIEWVDHELSTQRDFARRDDPAFVLRNVPPKGMLVMDFPLHSQMIEVRPGLCADGGCVSVSGFSKPKPPPKPVVRAGRFPRGTFAKGVLPLEDRSLRPLIYPTRSDWSGEQAVTFRCTNCYRKVTIPNPWSWSYRMCDCGLRWTRADVRAGHGMDKLGEFARVFG